MSRVPREVAIQSGVQAFLDSRSSWISAREASMAACSFSHVVSYIHAFFLNRLGK